MSAEPVPVQYRIAALSARHAGSGADANWVLRDIDLDIHAGEQIAIVGPSGAGKTTLLAILALALAPQRGTLELFGQRPWDLSAGARHALRARLFLAPQTPPLPPRQRVVHAVLAGRLPHWSLAHACASLLLPREADVAFEALRRFGLEDKLYERVDRLSGGERQRVALARMLVADSAVMLADEPLAALDPTLAAQTLDVLRDEATRRGATLICSLHQAALAQRGFARLIGLRDGRIVFDRPATDVDADTLDQLYANEIATAPAMPATPPTTSTPRFDATCL